MKYTNLDNELREMNGEQPTYSLSEAIVLGVLMVVFVGALFAFCLIA